MARKRGNGEGSWYKRADGLWTYRVQTEQGRKAFVGKTKRICLDKYTDFLSKNEEFVLDPKCTVSAWAHKWYDTYKAHSDIQDGTKEQYYTNIKKYIDDTPLGNMRVSEVKPAHILTFMTLTAHRSDSFQKKLKAELWAIFDAAVDNDLCRKNPCKPGRSPSVEQKPIETRTWTQDECEIIASHARSRNDPMGTALLLFLYTGERRSEVLGLQWGDVDFEAMTIKVRRTIYMKERRKAVKDCGKTKASTRTIPMHPSLAEALARTPRRSLWLVPDNDGDYINPNTFSDRYNAVIASLPVRPLGTHAFRRALSTLLQSQGASDVAVAKILGHSKVETTNRSYTAVDMGFMERTMERLPY